MKTAWLVTIKEDDPENPLSYADRYRVYTEERFDGAVLWAKFNGYQDIFGVGFNTEIGILNISSMGKKEVALMHIEIREE